MFRLFGNQTQSLPPPSIEAAYHRIAFRVFRAVQHPGSKIGHEIGVGADRDDLG